MLRILVALLVVGALIPGCGTQQPPAAPAQNAEQNGHEHKDGHKHEDGDSHEDTSAGVTQLPAREVGPYKVSALHVGPLSDGHFNFTVAGGELKALRSWIGDEAATGAVITKANWENDHYCAHIEMPEAIPAGAALWFEIEGADGTTEKGSMPLAAQ